METIILVYTDQTEDSNNQNGWVVCHISKLKPTFNIFAGATPKEVPKLKLMAMEIDSDYDPNEDN